MRNLVLLCALGVALGIPTLIFIRARQMRADLGALVSERGLRSRDSCPIKSFTAVPNPEHLSWLATYEGELRSGVPMMLLILRHAAGGVTAQGIPIYTNVAGIYLPKPPATSESWLADFQQRAARSDGGVLVARPAVEGGAVLVWSGPASRSNVELHLAELERSLPARQGDHR